jgi:antitoxin component YwqK of YwqJK toxin-antitoxin module
MKNLIFPVFVVAICVTFACSRPEPPKYDVGNAQVQGHYDRTTGKLASITYDSNKNGKIDTWSYMDGTRVVRIEIDKDEDGRIDRWEYYTPDQKLEKVGYSRANNGKPDAWAYQGLDGNIAKIELAAVQPQTPGGTAGLQTGGTPGHPVGPPGFSPVAIIRTEFYESGNLARAEEDTNADGRIDKSETYKNGAVATVAFDTTGRGTPDRRLVYGPGGSVKVEVDPDGTGTFRPARKSP